MCKMKGSLLIEACVPDLVSVIVPTYNRAHLIEQTLDSVYQQTHRPLEVIVVDDGSTDNTVEVVRHWFAGRTKPGGPFRATYLCQRRRGPSAARNYGLTQCRGAYIQFLDSDDMLHREKLAVQVSALREQEAGFCVCNYQPVDGEGRDTGPVVEFHTRAHAVAEFPAAYPMNTPCPLYTRRAVMQNGGWDESLIAAEDFEYNFRMAVNGVKGCWIEPALLSVRRHTGEERIQNTPLHERFESMYVGLAKMEARAVERLLYSRALQNSLGLRAYQYYEHSRREGRPTEADLYLKYAWPRLFWIERARLTALRILPDWMICLCVAVKRMSPGRQR